MNEVPVIRDLVYLDFDKVASIFSQLEGGLVTEIKQTVEDQTEDRDVLKLPLPFFSPEFASISGERVGEVQSRILHHALLLRVEDSLFSRGLAVDLNTEFGGEPTNEDLRSVVEKHSYVRAEGHASIEDFQHINRIAEKFNDLSGFINQSTMASLMQTEEIQEFKTTLDQMKTEASGPTSLK